MDYLIRIGIKADEDSIRSLFIEMLKTIYDTDDTKTVIYDMAVFL